MSGPWWAVTIDCRFLRRSPGLRGTLPRCSIAIMRDPEGNEFCLLAPP